MPALKNMFKKGSRIVSSQGGFALLYAVLIGSLLVTIGLTISNIVTRELILSSVGKESQVAFYASDTGVECAYYWDVVQGAFSDFDTVVQPPNIKCNNQTITPDAYTSFGSQYSTRFDFVLDATTNTCAIVVINKTRLASSGESATEIDSYGRNNCSGSYREGGVERGIVVKY